MTMTIYVRTGLTGGGATDLDNTDGSKLQDKEPAWVFDGTLFYTYRVDASSGATQSVPYVIAPLINPGNKRFILQSVVNVATVMPPTGVEMQNSGFGMDFSMNATDPANDVDIGPGARLDQTGTTLLSTLGFTKALDAAWVAGDGNGGLLNGTKAANTIYDIYVFQKEADLSIDGGLLAYGDSISTYLPSGYAKPWWGGFVRTNSSGDIVGYDFDIDTIVWHDDQENIIASPNLSTSYVQYSLASLIPNERCGLSKIGAVENGENAGGYTSADGSRPREYILANTAFDAGVSDGVASFKEGWYFKSKGTSNDNGYLVLRETIIKR